MIRGTPTWLKVVGAFTVLGFALMAFDCALSDMRMQRCMRQGVFGAVSYLLYLGSWLLAGVLGVGVAERSKRNWVGWMTGIALVLVFGFILGWLGFEAPRGGGDEDISYRR
jgi:hypothetical protein